MGNNLDIFPVRVGVYENKNTEIHKNLLGAILESEKNSESRALSNVGGFQSDDIDPSITKDFCDGFLFEAVSNYLADGLCQPPFNIFMDSMWSNINYKGCYNTTHDHSFADFSFVYYLKAPKNSGSIVFEHPSPTITHNSFFFYGWRRHGTPANCIAYEISPKEKNCVIFPAFLRHSVTPNLTRNKRISVAGNLTVRMT